MIIKYIFYVPKDFGKSVVIPSNESEYKELVENIVDIESKKVVDDLIIKNEKKATTLYQGLYFHPTLKLILLVNPPKVADSEKHREYTHIFNSASTSVTEVIKEIVKILGSDDTDTTGLVKEIERIIEGKISLDDYALKSELPDLSLYALKTEVYSKSEIDDKFKELQDKDTQLQEIINNKISIGESYTKVEVDNLLDEKINSKISAVFRYKGSVDTESELPSENNQVGDTYNVIDTGANYSWNGSEWDKLSESIDLSPYALKTEIPTDFYSKTEVDDKLNLKLDIDEFTDIKNVVDALVYAGMEIFRYKGNIDNLDSILEKLPGDVYTLTTDNCEYFWDGLKFKKLNGSNNSVSNFLVFKGEINNREELETIEQIDLGDTYYNTTEKIFHIWNGSEWKDLKLDFLKSDEKSTGSLVVPYLNNSFTEYMETMPFYDDARFSKVLDSDKKTLFLNVNGINTEKQLHALLNTLIAKAETSDIKKFIVLQTVRNRVDALIVDETINDFRYGQGDI